MNVNTYATVKTDYWSESVKKRYNINDPYLQEFDWFWKDLINGFVTRLKLTWTVWTKGYVRCETVITMSEQQAFNYAETLKSAIKDVKEFRNKQEIKKENKATIKEANEGDCV